MSGHSLTEARKRYALYEVIHTGSLGFGSLVAALVHLDSTKQPQTYTSGFQCTLRTHPEDRFAVLAFWAQEQSRYHAVGYSLDLEHVKIIEDCLSRDLHYLNFPKGLLLDANVTNVVMTQQELPKEYAQLNINIIELLESKLDNRGPTTQQRVAFGAYQEEQKEAAEAAARIERERAAKKMRRKLLLRPR